MSVMTSVIPRGRPFTVDDLEGMPDDGNRYELIDGMLLVSPAPNWAHQEMGATLYVQLRAACPADLRVMIAPFAVRTAADSEVQPDVLVTRYADVTSGPTSCNARSSRATSGRT
jgi:Uma2 family endonuclease